MRGNRKIFTSPNRIVSVRRWSGYGSGWLGQSPLARSHAKLLVVIPCKDKNKKNCPPGATHQTGSFFKQLSIVNYFSSPYHPCRPFRRPA
ncbi:MAG: hypothetical protein FWC97_03540 [Treponema sp.]|nr:hypothetical protein [Treponema sp.]